MDGALDMTSHWRQYFDTCSVLAVLVLGPAGAGAQQRVMPVRADSAVPSSAIAKDAPQPTQRLRIGPGDLLEVTVFDVPELAQAARVSDTGEATFTLIGRQHVAGLTTDEA